MDLPNTFPRALVPGDTIRIVAPASTTEDHDAFQRGVVTLEQMGFKVQYDERIFENLRYLAGEDGARAEELMRAFEDPETKAILALRGGYGCSRLIPLLDERRIRSRCKVFMGFSDLTTLHLFFRRRFGWVTVHGPTAASAALSGMPPEMKQHLLSLWTDPDYRPVFSFPQLESWAQGTAEGRLVGGCLSLLAASVGTSFEPKTDGKILFLEDVEEPPYRIDRMLQQLKLAGKLDKVAGILLGTFHECGPSRGDYSAEDTLKELLTGMGIPILADLPAGHGPENWPFALGARVRFDANLRRIEFLEGAVV
jgi:muramoyltetrapeptide carboxypeptidase